MIIMSFSSRITEKKNYNDKHNLDAAGTTCHPSVPGSSDLETCHLAG